MHARVHTSMWKPPLSLPLLNSYYPTIILIHFLFVKPSLIRMYHFKSLRTSFPSLSFTFHISSRLFPSPPPPLFFFELHSAYSRAYNLTPPSSLTLSLHPLAKLPFCSRGNPLISQPLRLPRGGRGQMWSERGGDTCRTQNPSNDCGLGFD